MREVERIVLFRGSRNRLLHFGALPDLKQQIAALQIPVLRSARYGRNKYTYIYYKTFHGPFRQVLQRY